MPLRDYLNRIDLIVEQNEGIIQSQLIEILNQLEEPIDLYDLQKKWHEAHPKTPQHEIIIDQKIENNLVDMISQGLVDYDEDTGLMIIGDPPNPLDDEDFSDEEPEDLPNEEDLEVPKDEEEELEEAQPDEEEEIEEEPKEPEPMPVSNLKFGESWKRPPEQQ